MNLLQAPQDRLSPQEIGTHTWLHGTETAAKNPLPNHLALPRSIDSQEPLTTEEEDAFKQLEDWGLPRRRIVQATEQGARSALIATYRILLHRLFNADDLHEALGDESLHIEGQSRICTPEPSSQGGSR